MTKRQMGLVFVVVGAVLIVSALLLLCYNTIEAKNAGDVSSEVLSSLHDVIAHPVQAETIPGETLEEFFPTEEADVLTEPEVLESYYR